MTGHRPVVVAAVADGEWRTHVRTALDPWTALVMVPTIRTLSDDAMGLDPNIVLWHLGSTADVDTASVAAMRLFRMRAPRAAVLAYCQISVPVAPLLVAAGRAGIDRLLLRGHDDLACAIRRELGDWGIEAQSRELVARLELPDGMAWQVLAHCVRRVGARVPTVEELTDEFAVSRKTLRKRLYAVGLPSPEQVIGWSRVLVAGIALEVSDRSVVSIADQLGFSSESAMRGMLARYADLTPSEIRRPGGVATLIARFRASLGRVLVPRGVKIPR